jgi:hypothetical protein
MRGPPILSHIIRLRRAMENEDWLPRLWVCIHWPTYLRATSHDHGTSFGSVFLITVEMGRFCP